VTPVSTAFVPLLQSLSLSLSLSLGVNSVPDIVYYVMVSVSRRLLVVLLVVDQIEQCACETAERRRAIGR